MSIAFPADPRLTSTIHETVAFAAEVDGVTRGCEISHEALQDQFGARSNQQPDLFGAFASGRQQIEAIARRKLAVQGLDGRLLITNSDF